jgi:hypothetical protein
MLSVMLIGFALAATLCVSSFHSTLDISVGDWLL